MKVHSATLAGGDNNQDRLFVTDNAVIVLDGASAFEPVDVDAGLYAETLGAVIAEQLDQHPDLPIANTVATGVRHTSQKLNLSPGRSPSSTVSVLRHRSTGSHLYVLGDTPIHYGTRNAEQMLTDDRLSALASPERSRYVNQLREGYGYGPDHRASLLALQRAQRDARNRPDGYWIAETDPEAAHHGLSTTLGLDAITWAVLATDGAADAIDHQGVGWPAIARQDSGELAALLRSLDRWETITDPDGIHLPRAKRHDDKTVAVVDFSLCPRDAP